MLRALIFAALGWLLIAAQAQPVGEGGGSNEAASKPNERSAENAPIAPGPRRVSSKVEAPNRDSTAEKKLRDERERRDLIAQEDMAYWAKSMFWAAFTQAVLSFIAIILVYVTFREARRAADSGDSMAEEAAKATAAAIEASEAGREANEIARSAVSRERRAAIRAAREAKLHRETAAKNTEAALATAARNADAAVRHVQVIQDTARLQARAYVGFWEMGTEHIRIPEENDNAFAFRVRWKNTGSTPAQKCQVWMLMRAFSNLETARKFDFEFEPLPADLSGVIAPGAITDGPTAVMTMNQFRSGSTVIAARVEYMDVFSKKVRVSEVKMIASVHPTADGGLTFTYAHAFPATAT